VEKTGNQPAARPLPLDRDEPGRVLEAVKALELRYVVITSVTRDDLDDGGAGQYACCIELIRSHDPDIGIEVLTPDFQEKIEAIDTVAEAGPDVFNHNVETVPRLYGMVRPQADYGRSLRFLKYIHENYPHIYLKSGLMVGLGEKSGEVLQTLHDLYGVGCMAVTIGQYLQPEQINLPVQEYIDPETFKYYEDEARHMGFRYIASGPYVRSSYMADRGYDSLTQQGR
jgi:lipoic acid synthetase